MSPGTSAVFVVTAYACLAGEPCVTKAGTTPVPGFTLACDPTVLPIGSAVTLEGHGERWCHDTGGKIKGRRLDLYLGVAEKPRTRTECVRDQWRGPWCRALKFGVQRLRVQVTHRPR